MEEGCKAKRLETMETTTTTLDAKVTALASLTDTLAPSTLPPTEMCESMCEATSLRQKRKSERTGTLSEEMVEVVAKWRKTGLDKIGKLMAKLKGITRIC